MGLITFLFNACKTEPNAQAVRKEVLNIHDKLMIDGEKVIKNKMKLDSILKADNLKTPADSIQIANLITRLNKADENMMDWMHFFKDDFKGKNDKEDLNYFKSEMIKIRGVEDNYIKVIRDSDSLLKIYKVVAINNMKKEHHSH